MAEIRVEHATDELGHDRPGFIVAWVDGRAVAAASRVAGSVPEQWVAHRFGTSERYVTNLSEVAARETLLGWASEAAS